MTSNVGAGKITEKKRSFGFSDGNTDSQQNDIKELVLGELKRTFRPEFINRVDDIIVFTKLTDSEIAEIADKMLQKLGSRLASLDISLKYDSDVKTALARAGFDDAYGARPLRREIQNKIEDALSEKILEGEIKKGDTVICKYTDNRFVFETAEASKALKLQL